MNKHIFYIAAACVALASCVKNEVRVNAPDKEITFQTVSTKAGGAAFETNKHFFSYAYFLGKGKNWDDNHDEAKAYIDNALITYITPASGKGYWAAADTYYWPKQGSLTFFAWTDNTIHDPTSNPTPSIAGDGASVSCAHDTGIKITDYSVKDNLNKDILVAEIAKKKKSNESATGDWEQGVPTVFRHALAKVEFKVNKKTNYPNVEFRVKKITLTEVSTRGTFTQYQSNPNPENWGWNGWGIQEDLTVFTGDKEVTATDDAGTFDKLTPSATDYYIVLPQVLKDKTDPTITIEYEIITSYVAGKPVTETVIDTQLLKNIYKNDWECNKNYILGITLGLNEIYWDPSVEAWEDNTVTGIEF